jgi:antitoxin component YwqK of YwqJK toxin-antitoxin module
MKKLLTAMFVALLMAGCGEDSKKPGSDGSESNQTSAETPPAKTAQDDKINLDDNETLAKTIAGAIDLDKLQRKEKAGEILYYAPNKQTPYTGWVKRMHGNGQIAWLVQYKDGKKWKGLCMAWYENGQKNFEGRWKKSKKPWTVVVWKPNGEKCPDTNLKDGNGVLVYYDNDGREFMRTIFKDGVGVKDTGIRSRKQPNPDDNSSN